jgi:hypothetical protein
MRSKLDQRPADVVTSVSKHLASLAPFNVVKLFHGLSISKFAFPFGLLHPRSHKQSRALQQVSLQLDITRVPLVIHDIMRRSFGHNRIF